MAHTRIRFRVAWTVRRDPVQGPWHTFADFVRETERHLVQPFPHYHAQISVISAPEARAPEGTLVLDWAVNLDMVPGRFHETEDYAHWARIHLDEFGQYGVAFKIEVVEVIDLTRDLPPLPAATEEAAS